MDKFQVEFYTKDNGEKPAKDFILSLDTKIKAKILGLIDVLEEKGTQLRNHTVAIYKMAYSKSEVKLARI